MTEDSVETCFANLRVLSFSLKFVSCDTCNLLMMSFFKLIKKITIKKKKKKKEKRGALASISRILDAIHMEKTAMVSCVEILKYAAIGELSYLRDHQA